MRNTLSWTASLLAFAAGAAALASMSGPAGYAQQQQRLIIFDPLQGIHYADANDRSVRALPVRDNIYMIVGAGGNITVQTGDDGVLIVDSGSGAAMNAKVQNLVRQLSTKPIHYIVNTNFRPDHTGGNQALRGTAGG